jgi:hypothetical protein
MNRTKSFCLHPTTHAVSMPQDSRHYKRLECAHCGAFLRFLPWPEHLQTRYENLRRIKWILRNAKLTPEDDWFIDDVFDARGRLSPSQQARVNELCARCAAPIPASIDAAKGGAH